MANIIFLHPGIQHIQEEAHLLRGEKDSKVCQLFFKVPFILVLAKTLVTAMDCTAGHQTNKLISKMYYDSKNTKMHNWKGASGGSHHLHLPQTQLMKNRNKHLMTILITHV